MFLECKYLESFNERHADKKPDDNTVPISYKIKIRRGYFQSQEIVIIFFSDTSA